jgi:HK97 family phage prohead protease
MERNEFKFAAEALDARTGKFAGYGAVFGNIDTHGDLIEPGAFAQTIAEWKARASFPTMKLMHGTGVNPFSGSDLPIGKWLDMREDTRGLFMEGKISGLNTETGKYHYALMEDGALNGLSIGYKTRKSQPGNGVEVKRRLLDVNLREVSLVPEGSNDQALVTELKAARQLEDFKDRFAAGERLTVREWETMFKSVFQLSNNEAERAVRINLKGQGEPDGTADEARAFLLALRG